MSIHQRINCLKEWNESLKKLKGYKKPNLKPSRWDSEVEYLIKSKITH